MRRLTILGSFGRNAGRLILPLSHSTYADRSQHFGSRRFAMAFVQLRNGKTRRPAPQVRATNSACVVTRHCSF